MQIVYAFDSNEGPARENNEDFVIAHLPADDTERRSRGYALILADGMGGHVRGEVASRMACELSRDVFLAADPSDSQSHTVTEMVSAANLAIYNDNTTHHRDRPEQEWGRMGTTLTICLLRDDELTIGHVGDCRVYLIQGGRIKKLTSDHSYAAAQQKLGLINAHQAAESPYRSVLTRSIGNEPFLRPDVRTVKLQPRDVLVTCCDGVWSKITDGEILEAAGKNAPEEACKILMKLAVKRFAEDNLTIQIAQVTSVEPKVTNSGSNSPKEASHAMADELQIGEVLDGRYLITDAISRSGMAMIFKATDQTTGKPVALKVPFMRFESDPGFYSRFEREQEIGRALDHPFILHLADDAEQEKSRPYLVMEYLEGQTLGKLMEAVHPMPVHDALRLASFVCDALHYLHQNRIVHRDLKPDNIMICSDGTIRIMDFGIAKYEGQRRLTFGGFTPAMGTPDYMAPEQVKGKRGDARTDIYSLGAILYEMLTGQTPFQGGNPFVIMNSRITGDPPSPGKLNDAITPQIEEIVLHAMARSPEDRYATALEMKRDLEHPDQVQVTGRAERLIQPSARGLAWRRMRVVVLCLAIPILIVAAFWAKNHVVIK